MTGILRAACLFVCGLSLGCSQTATFRKLQPPHFDVSGHRLGVVDVPTAREESRQALDVFRSRMAQSGVSLVDQQTLQRAASFPVVNADGSANAPAALEAARRIGLDSLLVTNVSFVEHDGAVYGSKSIRFGDPSVTAALRYELLDVRTGNVLDRNTVRADYYKGEMDARSEPKVLAQLAQAGGVELANALTPHEVVVEVPLADSTLAIGSTDHAMGVHAAKQGNWHQARAYWGAAVRSEPENDAALYNLGLACEALGEPRQARRLIETAAAINSDASYERALERLRQSEDRQRMAARNGSVLPSRGNDRPPSGPRLTRLPSIE